MLLLRLNLNQLWYEHTDLRLEFADTLGIASFQGNLLCLNYSFLALQGGEIAILGNVGIVPIVYR